MLILISFVVGTILSTMILMAAIVLVGGEPATKENFLKALGLSAFSNVVALLPVFGLLQIVIYIGGLMILLEKDFLEALLITVAVVVINLAVGFCLAWLLSLVGLIGDDTVTETQEFDAPPPAIIWVGDQ